MNFITKLNFTADILQMKLDLNTLLEHCPWPEEDYKRKSGGNQIGISYRPDAVDPWLDADGSLFDKQTMTVLGKESDFTEINNLVPAYTKGILEKLSQAENTKFGRIRFMRLMPKRGLSIHADMEQRFHFVLDTNPYALFGEYTGDTDLQAKCYHIPCDGHFYRVDTTRNHFVYNGGWEPRIHLVICEAK
jgi:hypothetical protein